VQPEMFRWTFIIILMKEPYVAKLALFLGMKLSSKEHVSKVTLEKPKNRFLDSELAVFLIN
jgi:hypothetical protein